MLRKCCFVLLAIFLRQYGPAPQVVAAALILVAALSAELQNLPYQDKEHDRIETIGLQACLLQLLVALLCNLVGLESMEQSTTSEVSSQSANLGPISTVILICVVFGSTVVFYYHDKSDDSKFQRDERICWVSVEVVWSSMWNAKGEELGSYL